MKNKKKSKEFKVPKKIKILGTTWTVKILSEKPSDALGQTFNKSCVIKLWFDKKDHNPERFEQTFYHELTHALIFSCTGPTHNTEDVVIPLSKGLKQIFEQLS